MAKLRKKRKLVLCHRVQWLWHGSYHGEGQLRLLQEGLRKQGDVDTLWDRHRAPIEVSNDHVELRDTALIEVN